MAPRLQLAVDSTELVPALGKLREAAPHVDVLEAGTILLLGEGLRAVSTMRALWPDKTILADVRIAEAGSLISKHCFEAGADWVSCVAGASLTTIDQVVAVARRMGGEVQVELGEPGSEVRAPKWRDLGVQHVIVKRPRDLEAAGVLAWSPRDVERVGELAALGFAVSVTGGVGPDDLELFAGVPVGIVIAGRSILGADDPGRAALDMRAAIKRVWP